MELLHFAGENSVASWQHGIVTN